MTPYHDASSDLTNCYTDATFLIFCHIQKTAGMTVQRYLRKRLGPSLATRALWRMRKDPRLHDLVTAARARTKRDRHFGGHFCFGIHEHLPKPATYMTFLRDPMKRIVSLYNYSQRTPGAYYHGHARDVDLATFVSDSGLMELDNGMVRFIAGSSEDHFINRTPVGQLDEDVLDLAKRNLDRYFCFVGVQEHFDESFLLLSRIMGDEKPQYLSLNVERKGLSLSPIDPNAIEIIRAKSALDQQLYDHACKRLKKDLAEQVPDLEDKLVAFRTRNAVYNRRRTEIYRWVAPFRAALTSSTTHSS